jgi:hypothetical protein
MYQIYVYIPTESIEKVKLAMFEAGAGKIGDYEYCCFEYSGKGQFKPLAGSQPYVGKLDQVEKVHEIKVEMVCEQKYLQDVISSMKNAHPYEEVAFGVIKLEEF